MLQLLKDRIKSKMVPKEVKKKKVVTRNKVATRSKVAIRSKVATRSKAATRKKEAPMPRKKLQKRKNRHILNTARSKTKVKNKMLLLDQYKDF